MACDVLESRVCPPSMTLAGATFPSASLANIAIRVGRKIQYDPVKEEIVGDEEANRLVYQPMRAPWHL